MASNGSTSGSPCGACKFLRRKCAAECIFAPYFCSEQGPARFAAIHKVFGASNVSKLLLHVPVPDRCEAVVTIAYEAQARIRDPVYGCVAHIFALQQQVTYLQTQLMQMKAQMAQNLMDNSSRNKAEHQWPTGILGSSSLPFQNNFPNYSTNNNNNNYSSISPQSSLDSIDQNHHHGHDFMSGMQDIQSRSDDILSFQPYAKKNRPSPSQTADLSELQALAFRMMKDEN